MKKSYTHFICCLFLFQCPFLLWAQNNVGVNTVSPNANAALEVKALGYQGFLMPRLPGSDTTNFSLTASDAGLMFFDNVGKQVLFWTGAAWKRIAASTSSPSLTAQNGLTYTSGTLEMGGSFLKDIFITTDLGGLTFQGSTGKPININNSGSTGTALSMTTATPYGIQVSNSNATGYAISGVSSSAGTGIYAVNTGTGTALYAKSTGGYAAIFSGGNVGIGNTSPSYPLDVTGNVRISSLAGPGIVVANAAGLLSISTATYLSATGTPTDNVVPYWTSGTLSGSGVMNSDANSVSIGTPLNAAYKLYVTTTSTTATALYAKSNGGYAAIFSGGNVGIGNTAPSYPLDVTGNARISGLVGPGIVVASAAGLLSISTATYLSASGTPVDNAMPYWTSGALSGSSVINSDANSVSIGTALNSAYKLYVTTTSTTATALYAKSNGGYAAIFSGGNVGIGNTSPTYPLDVTGNARISGLVGPGFVVANATGLLSISTANYLKASSTAIDYTVPYWTNDTLNGNSTLSSDANSVSIGTALNSAYKLYVTTSSSTATAFYAKSNGGYAGIFTGGFVGIGTTSPSYALDVTGNLRVSSLSGPGIVIADNTGLLSISTAQYLNAVSSTVDNTVPFWTGGDLSASSVLNADANTVSIGDVLNSSYKLYVNAKSPTPALYTIQNGAGAAFYAKSSGGYAGIFTGGNVGIGNLTPNYALDVTGNVRVSGLAGPGVIVSNSAGLLSVSSSNFVTTGGTGTDNTVPYWTSGALSTTSVLNSNATSVSIGAALDNTLKLYVYANTTTSAFYTRQDGNGAAIQGNSYGSGNAIVGLAAGAGNAIYGRSAGAGSSVYADQTGTGIALYANAQSATGTAFYANSSGGYSGIFMGGNVGIGTSAPSTKLHISSTTSPAFRLVDGTQAAGYVLTSDANGNASWQSVAANTKVAFRANSTSGQTMTFGTTQLTYNSVAFNDGGGFSANTFTAPSPGVYHFEVYCLFNPLTSDGRIGAFIDVNGNPVARNYVYASTDYTSASVTVTVKLAAGDQVTASAYNGVGAAQSLYTPAYYNYFAGFKVY